MGLPCQLNQFPTAHVVEISNLSSIFVRRPVCASQTNIFRDHTLKLERLWDWGKSLYLCADFRRLLLGVRAALQAYALEGTVTLSSFSSLCLRVREALLSPLTHPFLCAQVCFFPALDGCVFSPEEFFRFSVGPVVFDDDEPSHSQQD